MIKFIEEYDPTIIFQDLEDLLLAHTDEVCMFEEDCMLSPDWQAYKNMSNHGILHVVTARKENNALVGYCSTICMRHPHYSFTVGLNDLIYLMPEYRGHGIRFIEFVEQSLRIKGVKIFIMSVKPHVDFSKVLKRRRYRMLETNYFKRL